MKSTRAIVLPTVIAGMSVLFLLGSIIALLSNSNLVFANRYANGARGYYVADYGLAQAEGAILAAPSTGYPPFSGPVTGTVPNTNDSYSVSMYQGAMTPPDGTVVPVGYSYMISTATLGTGQTRQSACLLASDGSGMVRAGFMSNTFTLTGVVTTFDAWNSNNGTVAYTAALRQPAQSIIGEYGTAANINLSGNATIYGDILVQSGINLHKIIESTGSATYSGVKRYTQQYTPPTITVPVLPPGTIPAPGLIPAGFSYGALTIGLGQTYQLGAGSYVFTGITVQTGGQLQIAALAPLTTVNCIVNGDMTFEDDDTLVNMNSNCQSFTLMVPGMQSITMASGASAYVNLFAPASNVVMQYQNHGHPDLFGAVVANNVSVKGASYHFDTSLLSSGVAGSVQSGQLCSVICRLHL